MPNPETIRTLDEVKSHLKYLYEELQKEHKAIYNFFAGVVAAETPNWKIEEVGSDLIVYKKVSGVWVKKGAFTE